MNKSVSPPEGIPRLYDLVRVADERFRAAFYFALRNTLVASDLDQAVRVAYQGNKCQWRVVSESGELIDTSGTMAGGGKQARRGGMKSSIATAAAISPEELRDAERQLQQASDQLTALRKRKAALQREIASMEDLLPKLEVAYTKMQAELTATEEQLEDMRGQVAVLEKEAGGPSKAELQQIEAIDATVTEQKAVYDAAAAEAKVIEDQIAALQENVRTAGGKRLEKAKAAAEAAAEAVDTAVKALAKARAGIKSSTKAHATAEKNLAKMQAELESTTAKQETLKAEFKQLEEDAMEVMQTHDQARKVAKAKEEEVGEMKKAFEALNKTVTTVREVLVDIQNALQDYQENLKTNRKKEQHWSAKLQQLTCEYELLMKELPVDEETSADTALPPQPASSESATDADADEAMTGETEDTPATTTAAQAPSSMPALRQYTAEELAEFDVVRTSACACFQCPHTSLHGVPDVRPTLDTLCVDIHSDAFVFCFARMSLLRRWQCWKPDVMSFAPMSICKRSRSTAPRTESSVAESLSLTASRKSVTRLASRSTVCANSVWMSSWQGSALFRSNSRKCTA